jgi:hypothetical protein
MMVIYGSQCWDFDLNKRKYTFDNKKVKEIKVAEQM